MVISVAGSPTLTRTCSLPVIVQFGMTVPTRLWNLVIRRFDGSSNESSQYEVKSSTNAPTTTSVLVRDPIVSATDRGSSLLFSRSLETNV